MRDYFAKPTMHLDECMVVLMAIYYSNVMIKK